MQNRPYVIPKSATGLNWTNIQKSISTAVQTNNSWSLKRNSITKITYLKISPNKSINWLNKASGTLNPSMNRPSVWPISSHCSAEILRLFLHITRSNIVQVPIRSAPKLLGQAVKKYMSMNGDVSKSVSYLLEEMTTAMMAVQAVMTMTRTLHG